MKIMVCIKQVPVLANTPMDVEKGILVRTGESKINPYDLPAIEVALKLRETYGGEIIALTMGPASADQALRTALSMTVDRACLMTHRAFGGADVLITAKTLAQGIKALGGADLIICGQQTTDGDTGQVPFSLAVQMGLPVMGFVRSIEKVVNNTLQVSQELTGITRQIEAEMPLVIAVNPTISKARLPGLRAKLKASKMDIQRLGFEDLEDKDPDHYGLKASPTRVFKLFAPQTKARIPALVVEAEAGAALVLQAWKQAKALP